MSATALRKPVVHGQASLRIERGPDGGWASGGRLAGMFHHDPLRWLFPVPRAGDPLTAVLATTSGGLVGGDRLDVDLAVAEGAGALVTTQAAEKVYRSTGADCRIATRASVAAGGWLEWMPQETIVFEGARLRRDTRLDLAADARILAGEMLVFGRAARGERLTRGLVRDAWEVAVDGRLVWAESLHLDGDIGAILDHPACFAGAGAYAMLVHAGAGAADLLPAARSLCEQVAGKWEGGVRAAATCIDGILVLRVLGTPAHAVRGAYSALWSGLRSAAAGLPTRLPRLWEV